MCNSKDNVYICGNIRQYKKCKKYMIMDKRQYKFTAWETIQMLYPDSFVLLENPVYEPSMPHLKGGILLYKHKNRTKVVEKELELKPHYSTLKYTGGIRGDRVNENVLIL